MLIKMYDGYPSPRDVHDVHPFFWLSTLWLPWDSYHRGELFARWITLTHPKIWLNNQLTIFQRLQHMNQKRTCMSPKRILVRHLKSDLTSSRQVSSRGERSKTLDDQPVPRGSRHPMISPWFNSFLWKIARYHTRHRTWRNIRWHRPECWRCHVRCPHSMYLICLLSRVGSITVNNLSVSKDGHGILMYFGGMGLTPLGWWDSKMGWFLQNSMGSTPIAILLLPDRIQADKANSTWPVRICISHVLLWAPSCLCLCHACRRIVGCRALASACQAGGIGLAADVDVDAAALVVVLPRRNKKAQPKEQTSW